MTTQNQKDVESQKLIRQVILDKMNAWLFDWNIPDQQIGFVFDRNKRTINYYKNSQNIPIARSIIAMYYIPSQLLINVDQLEFIVKMDCSSGATNNFMGVGYFQDTANFIMLKTCGTELVVMVTGVPTSYTFQSIPEWANFKIVNGQCKLLLNGNLFEEFQLNLNVLRCYPVIECDLVMTPNSTLSFLETLEMGLSNTKVTLKKEKGKKEPSSWSKSVILGLMLAASVASVAAVGSMVSPTTNNMGDVTTIRLAPTSSTVVNEHPTQSINALLTNKNVTITGATNYAPLLPTNFNSVYNFNHPGFLTPQPSSQLPNVSPFGNPLTGEMTTSTESPSTFITVSGSLPQTTTLPEGVNLASNPDNILNFNYPASLMRADLANRNNQPRACDSR